MEKMLNENELKSAVDEILTRGVGKFIDPDDVFRKKLIAKARGEYKEDIVIKFGVDPTRPDIHLGHAVVLRKLRKLQDLGCKVVFLVGDITAQIGDPTGKSKVRPEVEYEAIQKNLSTYLDQIDKIINVERNRETGKIIHSKHFSWIKNSDWYLGIADIAFSKGTKALLKIEDIDDGVTKEVTVDANSFFGKAGKFNFEFSMQRNELGNTNMLGISLINLLAILRYIPFSQLIERDMFQERIKSGEPLFMHEMLYPILQGVDSRAIHDIYGSCDLEIGGTDQTFNMLMGRKIMETVKQKPQAVLSCELLVGLDGKEKMSKSLDNYVGITDEPADMFGKLMSVPDAAMETYLELCTFTSMDDVGDITKKLVLGKVHPRDVKMDLAQQIVEIYHGREAGVLARESFVNTFQKKEMPADMPVITVESGALLADILVAQKIIASKTEFRRLIDEGAVREDGELKITDPFFVITGDMILKIGKHRFVKLEKKK